MKISKKKWLMIIIHFTISIQICNAQMYQEWARRYNQRGDDAASAICVDDSGNVIVTGGIQIPSGYKCTTIKYNKYGDTLWVRDYQKPGNTNNLGNDIQVDDSGNIYVAGAVSLIKYDRSGNLKWTAYDTTDYRFLKLDSNYDIYAGGLMGGRYVVAKYDRNGNKYWINKRPGAYKLKDLTLDVRGNILIVGESNYVSTNYDYTTIKYSNDGNVIWVRRYNGLAPDSYDYPEGVTTDNVSNVYVTGASEDASQIFNCTTIKYDSAGNVIWIKRMYPPSNGYDIQVDKSQNVYLASRSNGNNYAMKLNIYGEVIWTRTYPTTNIFAANKPVLILDSVNNVYVTANIDSSNYTRYGAIKYDNNGNQIFVINYHYVHVEFNYVYDMAVDKKGSVYLTGTSNTAYATVKYSPIPTGISENNILPDKFLLGQNYPNPFNPKTVINYELRFTSFVSLKVYDVLGNEVANLVDEKKDAGAYEVGFDASNFASGIYFYRLEAEGEILDTKRMVLLK